MIRRLFLFFAIIFSICFAEAQELRMQGVIRDSLETLPNANIIARALHPDTPVAFAISDAQGSYTLKLQPQQAYVLTVSYLGYLPQTDTIQAAEGSLTRNFFLSPVSNNLEEVVLHYKMPLQVKEDTLVYQVEHFANGRERKLREVLRKLPGVEVDRDGNVAVQGKKVTRVLVEDKLFFTGDSKLAVNNIPADAVEAVQVLDNYNEVSMLKGLQDSDQMALNIKLKEDKKKFAFGDMEAGAGPDERYLLHPTLFYYSPKANYNAIADLNNTGRRSYTFQDYIDFEGGYTQILNNPSASGSVFKSDFARFLSQTDYSDLINRFGAFNSRLDLGSKASTNSYVIFSDARTREATALKNFYLQEDDLTEDRLTASDKENQFILAKVRLDYDPGMHNDLIAELSIRSGNAVASSGIVTNTTMDTRRLRTREEMKSWELKPSVHYTAKLSDKHTGTLTGLLQWEDRQPESGWNSNQPFLQPLLPLQTDSVYRVLQDKRLSVQRVQLLAKDYWVLGRFHHLYSALGVNFNRESFRSLTFQDTSSSERDFVFFPDFANDNHMIFTDIYSGLEYKFQKGIFVFKPALYLHFYQWQNRLLKGDSLDYQNFAVLLPQFRLQVNLASSEKLKLDYALKAQTPSLEQMVPGLVIRDFNSIYRGEPMLDYALYHQVNLSYYRFSLYRNLMMNGMLTYQQSVRSLKDQYLINGIEQVATTTLFSAPEKRFVANYNMSKRTGALKYNLKTTATYQDQFQLLNQKADKNVFRQVSATLSIKTFFGEAWPSAEAGYTKEFSAYRTPVIRTDFTTDTWFVELEQRLFRNFSLQADYRNAFYRNADQSISNRFDIANTSITYQGEDSPWGFTLSGSNLFDVKFRQTNSISDVVLSDQRIFIYPRVLLFRVFYKL